MWKFRVACASSSCFPLPVSHHPTLSLPYNTPASPLATPSYTCSTPPYPTPPHPVLPKPPPGGSGPVTFGVALHVRLMILKVMAADGTFSAARALEAFDYAQRMGARIVVTSLGNPYPDGVPATSPPAYQQQWAAVMR